MYAVGGAKNMNLIKLNPLKKLMLVVLSWFVHSVYHVDCFAWTAKACAAASNCYAAGNCNNYRTQCCGTSYVSAFNGAHLSEYGYYVYRTNNTTSIAYPNTTLVCLSQTDINNENNSALGGTSCCTLFGQTVNTIYGTCTAFDNASDYSAELVGVVLHVSTLGVSCDKTNGVYVGVCSLTPGRYVSTISWPSTLTVANANITTCPAGYYCTGGAIGGFVKSSSGVSAGKGRTACGAGYYCPAGTYARQACAKGYYANGSTLSTCTRCPSYGGVYGTTANTGVSNPANSTCYISANTTMTSSGHSFVFTGTCYYS